jgi:membrane-associated protease RseP (regulator of RpoE activity)
MLRRTVRLRPTVALALLVLASAALRAGAQEDNHIRERRVLVWQGGPGEIVELEAGLGKKGFLGVALIDLTPELRSYFGVPEDRGILVSQVVHDSPASTAGLRVGDVLTAIDGQPVRGVVGFQLTIARGGEGSEVELEHWRDGRPAALRAALEVRDRSQFDISPLIGLRHSIPGHVALELKPDSATELEIDGPWVEGVVGRVGQRLTDASVLAQLETMRVERRRLQETLDSMEERLRQLEAELGALGDEGQ